MQSKTYSDNINLAVYSMGGPEKCFVNPDGEVTAETSGAWKGRYENESSCSYSISVGSEEPRTRRERSKSLSQLDPDMASGEVARIRERLLRTNSHVEKSHLKNFSGVQRLTLLLLALVDFMGFCSMSIMAPFFPKEAHQKGLSDTVIGLIFSFYALIMFLTSPIFGKILPKVGTKFLFLGGILVVAITNILFGFLVYVDDFTLFTTLCILVRSIEALGACAYSTASYVYVVNSFPQSIGSVLGILETFVGLGMSTGPAIGGFLYSLGGFTLPFLVLGITMAITVPLNLLFLPSVEECNMSSKSTSFFKLIRIKEVLVIGLVVVFASSTWAFLDPTLEPHLRQFDLTTGKVGLIFLLFSALYAIASPIWGWCADKVDNHWSMMVVGLFISTVGLLLLGPCPYIPWLASANSLWLIIVALCILGVSIALTLLPTFRGILTSATDAGHKESLATYSVVAGIWSCLYSLGEVIGPSLGGVLLQYYGFPLMSTVMAAITLTIALITLMYFTTKTITGGEVAPSSDSGINESWRSSSNNSDDEESSETTSLLFSRTDHKDYRTYTEDKVQNYGESRRMDKKSGDIDENQCTDVRGTISITGGGACEV
ncbi:MFS-type transporter SLC18B1-like isoform X2 [Coccinella septempunctata]|uniref:MFS-type transporter SLC18B1-like isoform X2 n=1 Tax=Coccinella septempunctata TaxID=41139 RepID=UPI001D0719ED|nr:MFS-type transporter SLC18B1-like isoform X2 [Coccinella septempunctata]